MNKKIGVLGLRGFPHVMGGVERHCEHLYPRLARMGYDIFVCRRTPYITEKTRGCLFDGIHFIDVWAPRNKHLEAVLHSLLCIILLRLRGIRLVHMHSFGPAIVAPIARLFGQKVVLTYHLPNYMQGKWGRIDRLLLKGAERIACLFAHRIIAVSENNSRIIQENTARNSTVIYNGITPHGVLPHNVDKFGLKKQGYVFAASRFVPEKGIHLLLEAYRIASPGLKLVIAGDADHASPYSQQIKETASCLPGVVLTGFVSGNELESLFACAGVFVLPSYIEGLPIALLEAMSFGVPVIVSDIPPHRDIPLDESSFFPPGDIVALARILGEAEKNLSKWTKKAEELRGVVEQRYNWDTIADQTAAVYRQLIR